MAIRRLRALYSTINSSSVDGVGPKGMPKHWLGLWFLGLAIAAPVMAAAPALAVEPGAVDRLINTGECVGCDLEGADLAGLELSQVNLSKANLRQANLVGTDLQQALLQRSRFQVQPECPT